MPWVKEVSGQKTIYTAPPETYPLVRVVYDPKSKIGPWILTYAWVNMPDHSTQADIETVMRL